MANRRDLLVAAGSVGVLGVGAFAGLRRALDGRAAPGRLELFVESQDRSLLANCDNLTVSPWGDLIVCEDADTPCALVGVTPAGHLYRFGENAYTDAELAGACFAPDGRTLFVNVQDRGLTLAITGPFPHAREME